MKDNKLFMGCAFAGNHSPPCDCCDLTVATLFVDPLGGFVLSNTGDISPNRSKKWQQ